MVSCRSNVRKVPERVGAQHRWSHMICQLPDVVGAAAEARRRSGSSSSQASFVVELDRDLPTSVSPDLAVVKSAWCRSSVYTPTLRRPTRYDPHSCTCGWAMTARAVRTPVERDLLRLVGPLDGEGQELTREVNRGREDNHVEVAAGGDRLQANRPAHRMWRGRLRTVDRCPLKATSFSICQCRQSDRRTRPWLPPAPTLAGSGNHGDPVP